MSQEKPKQTNWILIGLVVVLGGYTYMSNQQVKNTVHDQAASAVATASEMASAATAAQDAAKAAQDAASAAQSAAESAAKVASSNADAAKAAAEKVAKAAEAAKPAQPANEGAETAAAPAKPAMMPPFGSKEDVGYAAKIWQAMLDQKLAGPDMLRSTPYEGSLPHGAVLELFKSQATIDGQTGDLIVKRNFGPEGVAIDEVLANPAKHLGAITVMFRREAGFDPEDKDWFWTKFMPDGSIAKNAKGMALTGKVAKGMEMGCIACHTNADGGDFVFSDVTLTK